MTVNYGSALATSSHCSAAADEASFFLSFFLSSSSFSSSSSWGLPSAALGRLISRHRFHLDPRSPRTESLESLSTFGVLHQWPEVTEIVFGTF